MDLFLIKGDEWGASVVLDTFNTNGTRDRLPARAPWRRSLRNSPRPGEPSTWRRETGGRTPRRRGTRDARRRNGFGIIRERGRRRLPLEDIYRQLFNPDLYLRAYGRIYRNDGAMTPGSTPRNCGCHVPGENPTLIDLLRQEGYRWTPVRRTYIPKKSGNFGRSAFRPGRINCCKK